MCCSVCFVLQWVAFCLMPSMSVVQLTWQVHGHVSFKKQLWFSFSFIIFFCFFNLFSIIFHVILFAFKRNENRWPQSTYTPVYCKVCSGKIKKAEASYQSLYWSTYNSTYNAWKLKSDLAKEMTYTCMFVLW